MAAFNEQILQGSQRPNFFELLAEKAMQEALRPAFEYVCKVGNPPFRPPPPTMRFCGFLHTNAMWLSVIHQEMQWFSVLYNWVN